MSHTVVDVFNALAEAAKLDKLEGEGCFAGARSPCDHDPSVGGQLGGQVFQDLAVQPLPAHKGRRGGVPLRHLEEQRLQQPLGGHWTCRETNVFGTFFTFLVDMSSGFIFRHFFGAF